MGIEDLLGGRDLGDVKKAVGFVMENSDDFQKVLDLVRGLPDDAVGFLGKLPELLKTHRGKYVAIHNEEIVAEGVDDSAVTSDAYARVGYVEAIEVAPTSGPLRAPQQPVHVLLVLFDARLAVGLASGEAGEELVELLTQVHRRDHQFSIVFLLRKSGQIVE